MRNAFISRDLRPGSPFASALTAAGWEVAGQSLLQLNALPFGPLPEMDWWFFSSANGVRFFFEQHPVGTQPNIGVLGPATADVVLAATGRIPDFTGDGNPATTAATLATLAAGQRVLFPGAEQSKRSVQTQLAGLVKGLHWPVYTNRPIPDPPDLRRFSVLAFTSPLNAQAYFSRWERAVGQRVVAIGGTTAAALRTLGVADVEVAATASEAALATTILIGA